MEWRTFCHKAVLASVFILGLPGLAHPPKRLMSLMWGNIGKKPWFKTYRLTGPIVRTAG